MTKAEEMRKYAEAHGFEIGNEQYVCPRPLPCVRDEHGEIKKQTITMLIAKINEELDELKERTFVYYSRDTMYDGELDDIAEEATDTITAITTMLEALGIDAEMRDDAQRRVNAKNKERGRL